MEQALDLDFGKVTMNLNENKKVISVVIKGEEFFFPSKLFSASGARYSDGVIAILEKIINYNLWVATQEYNIQKSRLDGSDGNDTNDTSPTFKILEEGKETLSKEEIGKLAVHQLLLIKRLQAALHRVKAKTIGICCVTGNFISLERLCCVPHTSHVTSVKS